MEINKNAAAAAAAADEEEKRSSSRRAFTLPPCIESDEEAATSSDEELEFEASYNGDDDHNYYYEYFSSRGTDAELGFLEELEYEDSQMEMEDEIDPDELSYEQLLELGEFIGEEKRGLSIHQISVCLRPITYQTVDIRTGTVDRCVVCQMEYEQGERLAGLIACKHAYHSECISQWLQIKKTCPICSADITAP